MLNTKQQLKMVLSQTKKDSMDENIGRGRTYRVYSWFSSAFSKQGLSSYEIVGSCPTTFRNGSVCRIGAKEKQLGTVTNGVFTPIKSK